MVNPLPSSMDTPNSQVAPPVLTPVGRLPLRSSTEDTPMRDTSPGPHNTDTLMLPHLTPQPSASLTAPPLQDQEEDMDSESKKGPESQQ